MRNNPLPPLLRSLTESPVAVIDSASSSSTALRRAYPGLWCPPHVRGGGVSLYTRRASGRWPVRGAYDPTLVMPRAVERSLQVQTSSRESAAPLASPIQCREQLDAVHVRRPSGAAPPARYVRCTCDDAPTSPAAVGGHIRRRARCAASAQGTGGWTGARTGTLTYANRRSANPNRRSSKSGQT